jgi:SpoVK/Ycf46/Vps4 family AAA+-type ATPase
VNLTLADIRAVFETTAKPAVATLIDEKELAKALSDLDALTGIPAVKQEIAELVDLVRYYRSVGKSPERFLNSHFAFTGNPGTGKTTVARILGRIFRALGLLERGHLVECDRQDLVAQWVGQTAPKTSALIDKALGGMLFIDEAYSLSGDSGSDSGFGSEAISTLVKAMEDKRDTLAVVVAGYSEDMNEFIKSNQGLKSRFQTFIEFEDYGTEELIKIFKLISSSTPVAITSEVEQAIREYITDFKPSGEDGNGRFARNLFEKMFLNLTTRAMADGTIDLRELEAFSVADVPQVPQKNPYNPDKPRIGFV